MDKEIKSNLVICLAPTLIFGYLVLDSLYINLLSSLNYSVPWWLIIVGSIIWYLFHNFAKNIKARLLEDRIHAEGRFTFFNITLFKGQNIMKWENIIQFNRSTDAGYLSGYMLIGENQKSANDWILLNGALSTFNEEHRQFIINHLKEEQIDESAKKPVKKSLLFSVSSFRELFQELKKRRAQKKK